MAGQMWPAGEPGARKPASKQAKAPLSYPYLSVCPFLAIEV